MARSTKAPNATTDAAHSETPKRIRLVRPHGFVDDDGKRRSWHAGRVVISPEEIELLVSRGAAIEILE